MLAKFAVKNFRGFTDRIELDLTRHSNYSFNAFAIKDGIIKNGIIYGPNGSGKTNFGLAIFDIVNHLSQKWKKQDYYVNFTFAGNQDLIVEFEYTFIFSGYTAICDTSDSWSKHPNTSARSRIGNLDCLISSSRQPHSESSCSVI